MSFSRKWNSTEHKIDEVVVEDAVVEEAEAEEGVEVGEGVDNFCHISFSCNVYYPRNAIMIQHDQKTIKRSTVAS